MKKIIKSKKVFGVFVAFAIVLAGVFTASYYVISSRADKEERPPSLSLSGKYQAFNKEGLQGFLKYEGSDQEAFNEKYKNTDKKSITLKEGVNYVYVNKQTEIEDIIECIDPVAERILIAQYKPEDKVFYTFPKGPGFEEKTEEFASVNQKLNPAEGFIIISRREAKAYCLKEPKIKADNNADEPSYGGWNLVASNDDKVKDLVKDFEQRVKTAWVMEDDDSFKKAPDFETELKDYYLVWLNMEPKPCSPEKEPHTVLMDYSHAIGNKDLAKLYNELPPSYQTALNDFVNTEVKEVLDNAKIDEIAPKVSSILKAFAQSVNDNSNKVLNVLPKDIKIPDGKKEQAKTIAVDALNLLASIADLLNKLATESTIDVESLLANDIVLLIAQAEALADQIASSDLVPPFNDDYSEYQKWLNVFKNIEVTAKDKQVEQATVTIKYPVGDLPKELENSPEKEDVKMERVVEADESCYWVPEGLPDIKDELEKNTKKEVKKMADDLNKDFTLGMKSQIIASLTEIETGIQDFNTNGKACELIGKSLTAYAEAMGSILDEEIAVIVENIQVDQGEETTIQEPGHMDFDVWQHIEGPANGTHEELDDPKKAKYTPDAGYTGEDWVLYSTRDAENNEGAILYCLNVI